MVNRTQFPPLVPQISLVLLFDIKTQVKSSCGGEFQYTNPNLKLISICINYWLKKSTNKNRILYFVIYCGILVDNKAFELNLDFPFLYIINYKKSTNEIIDK